MKILLVLLVAMFLAPFTIHAQKKYLAGFYVNVNGDTVRGLIAGRTRYGEGIDFRRSMRDPSEKLTPQEVQYFGLEDGTEFQTVTIKTPNGENKEFARSAMVGKIDLLEREEGYVYVDEKGVVYPIATSRSNNTDEVRKNYQKNAGTFNILFFGCEAVTEHAKRVEIEERSLREFLREYGKCKGEKFKELERPTARVYISPFVGYGFMNLNYKDPLYMKETQVPTVRSPFYGLTLLVHGKHRSRLSFLAEFGKSGADPEFETVHVRDEFLGPNHFLQTTNIKMGLGGSFFRVGMRFTGRSNIINPFAEVGLVGVGGGGGEATYDLTINNQTETGKKEEIAGSGGGGIWASVGLKKDLGKHIQLSFDTSFSLTAGASLFMPRLSLAFGE